MIKNSILGFVLLLCGMNGVQGQDHPRIALSSSEALEIRESLGQYALLDSAYEITMAAVAAAMASPVEVPPPGEGGSYEHEKHKQNYRDMHQAGLLYAITGEEKYAAFVKEILDRYADMYPTLGPHPMAHNQKPGRLFHQMLNETVWLTNTAIAYDCIYDWLAPADRDRYEQNIFIPMVEWFTGENAHEFDRIHNHGTWSVCSVGMIGMVMGREDWVNMALYGTDGSGKGGFLRQIDLLISPDGYYMEGPYYVRYAIRPLFKFAEALERNRPELEIYAYRDSILKKAYYAAVGTAFPNGVFPPINDASRTMDIRAPGIVRATALVYDRYGVDPNLYAIARIQGTTILSGNGLKLARGMASLEDVPPFSLRSTEYRDGSDGTQGGLGILRHGVGDDQMVLLMKYGVHGLGHGHFDKLHFILYDQGREIIPDYGFSRWINIEPKYGGRYLPENQSYAKQTVAHNTVVVDQTSQNDGDRKAADKVWGQRHFFHADDPHVQVMSAMANDHYPGVAMERTLFLIQDDRLEYPIVVDVYRLDSEQGHSYDYPIHFRGQLITTSFDYEAEDHSWKPLGDQAGYEHIWKTGSARMDGSPSVTWLDGHRYYTATFAAQADQEILFGMTGASDPNFNLQVEPLVIQRMTGQDAVLASVIEPHGYFNEATESSRRARSVLERVEVLGSDADGCIIEISGKDGYHLLIKTSHGKSGDKIRHKVRTATETFRWRGDYEVDFE